jgi:hypothetical protein
MIAFLKNVDNIKVKLVAVYALNVTDILLTLALQSTGTFREGNPVMALFMGSTASALAVKLVLPGALLALLYLRLRGATLYQLKKSNLLICALLALYALINISHIVWSVLYFFIYA